MAHLVLLVAVLMFVLWLVGLLGAWTAPTAWMMFLIGCCLLVAWAVVSYSIETTDRRDRFA